MYKFIKEILSSFPNTHLLCEYNSYNSKYYIKVVDEKVYNSIEFTSFIKENKPDNIVVFNNDILIKLYNPFEIVNNLIEINLCYSNFTPKNDGLKIRAIDINDKDSKYSDLIFNENCLLDYGELDIIDQLHSETGKLTYIPSIFPNEDKRDKIDEKSLVYYLPWLNNIDLFNESGWNGIDLKNFENTMSYIMLSSNDRFNEFYEFVKNTTNLNYLSELVEQFDDNSSYLAKCGIVNKKGFVITSIASFDFKFDIDSFIDFISFFKSKLTKHNSEIYYLQKKEYVEKIIDIILNKLNNTIKRSFVEYLETLYNFDEGSCVLYFENEINKLDFKMKNSPYKI